MEHNSKQNEIRSGQKHLEYFRMISLRGQLDLEIKGRKIRKPPTAYIQIKRDYKLKGSRKAVLRQFTDKIEQYFEGVN